MVPIDNGRAERIEWMRKLLLVRQSVDDGTLRTKGPEAWHDAISKAYAEVAAAHVSLKGLELRRIYSIAPTSAAIDRSTNEKTEVTIQESQVIEIPRLVCVGINERLARAIAQNPELLRQLHPRDFEEYMAELFAEFGYAVELTARTRDGGKDIIAIKSEHGIVNRLIVECKRYAPHRRVGVSLVRELFAVKDAVKANKAILATTSYFTKDAKREVERSYIYQLELKDFDAISEWARGYANFVKRVVPKERLTLTNAADA